MKPVYELNTCSLNLMFVLVLKLVVQIASLHFLLKFIATEKHFLTAKLKKSCEDNWARFVLSRGFVAKHLRRPTKAIEM